MESKANIYQFTEDFLQALKNNQSQERLRMLGESYLKRFASELKVGSGEFKLQLDQDLLTFNLRMLEHVLHEIDPIPVQFKQAMEKALIVYGMYKKQIMLVTSYKSVSESFLDFTFKCAFQILGIILEVMRQFQRYELMNEQMNELYLLFELTLILENGEPTESKGELISGLQVDHEIYESFLTCFSVIVRQHSLQLYSKLNQLSTLLEECDAQKMLSKFSPNFERCTLFFNKLGLFINKFLSIDEIDPGFLKNLMQLCVKISSEFYHFYKQKLKFHLNSQSQVTASQAQKVLYLFKELFIVKITPLIKKNEERINEQYDESGWIQAIPARYFTFQAEVYCILKEYKVAYQSIQESFLKMQSDQYRLDVTLKILAIKVCLKLKNVKEAQSIFQTLLDFSQEGIELEEQVKLNLLSLAKCIGYLQSKELHDQALKGIQVILAKLAEISSNETRKEIVACLNRNVGKLIQNNSDIFDCIFEILYSAIQQDYLDSQSRFNLQIFLLRNAKSVEHYDQVFSLIERNSEQEENQSSVCFFMLGEKIKCQIAKAQQMQKDVMNEPLDSEFLSMLQACIDAPNFRPCLPISFLSDFYNYMKEQQLLESKIFKSLQQQTLYVVFETLFSQLQNQQNENKAFQSTPFSLHLLHMLRKFYFENQFNALNHLLEILAQVLTGQNDERQNYICLLFNLNDFSQICKIILGCLSQIFSASYIMHIRNLRNLNQVYTFLKIVNYIENLITTRHYKEKLAISSDSELQLIVAIISLKIDLGFRYVSSLTTTQNAPKDFQFLLQAHEFYIWLVENFPKDLNIEKYLLKKKFQNFNLKKQKQLDALSRTYNEQFYKLHLLLAKLYSEVMKDDPEYENYQMLNNYLGEVVERASKQWTYSMQNLKDIGLIIVSNGQDQHITLIISQICDHYIKSAASYKGQILPEQTDQFLSIYEDFHSFIKHMQDSKVAQHYLDSCLPTFWGCFKELIKLDLIQVEQCPSILYFVIGSHKAVQKCIECNDIGNAEIWVEFAQDCVEWFKRLDLEEEVMEMIQDNQTNLELAIQLAKAL